jgi:hypothetical protein
MPDVKGSAGCPNPNVTDINARSDAGLFERRVEKAGKFLRRDAGGVLNEQHWARVNPLQLSIEPFSRIPIFCRPSNQILVVMQDKRKDSCREVPYQVQNTRAGGLVGNVEITGQMKGNRCFRRRDKREKPFEMIGGTTMQFSAHPRRSKNSAGQFDERVIAGKALFEQP